MTDLATNLAKINIMTVTDAEQLRIWEHDARAIHAKGSEHDALEQARVEDSVSPEALHALAVLAMLAEHQQDWRRAVGRWQLLASVTNPITTKSRSHVAQNVAVMMRWTTLARARLRIARCTLAEETRAQGQRRESDELIARIVETTPDQHALKSDKTAVNLVRSYVQDALRDDGVAMPPPLATDLVRIVLCYDVICPLTLDEVIRICSDLLRHHPQLSIHLVVSNERFIVSTPMLPPSFDAPDQDTLNTALRGAMPAPFDENLQVTVCSRKGLEGIVGNCTEILSLRPDVIVFAGGQEGPFSPESVIIRQCLYDTLATVQYTPSAQATFDGQSDLHAVLVPASEGGNVDFYAHICEAVARSSARLAATHADR